MTETVQKNNNLEEKKKTEITGRVIEIVSREEYLTEETILSVTKTYKTIKDFFYVLHNKDNADENPNEKKPSHWHVTLDLTTNVKLSQIAGWFNVPINFVMKKRGPNAFADIVRYLSHEDENQQAKGKYRYTDEEIKGSQNFREFISAYEVKKLNKTMSKKTKWRHKVAEEGVRLADVDRDEYYNDMSVLRMCRNEYIRKHAPLPALRTNFYVSGGSATGKSLYSRLLAKSLADPNNLMPDDAVYFVAGQGKSMFQGYDGQPVVIFDDLRAFDLLKNYDMNPGAIFNLFDPVPSASEQNIKFGSIKLINTIFIINSVESFHKFAEIVTKKQSDEEEHDKQIYRRFPLFIELDVSAETGNGYTMFINKQFFNDNEKNYKAYNKLTAFENVLGVKKVQSLLNKDREKYNSLLNSFMKPPADIHAETLCRFEKKYDLEGLSDEDIALIEDCQQTLFDNVETVDFKAIQEEKKEEEEKKKTTYFNDNSAW